MHTNLWIAALFSCFIAGCGPYRASTDPDAMSESEHRARASAERRRAESHRNRYSASDIRSSDTTHGTYGGIEGSYSPGGTHATPAGQVVDPGAGHLSAERRLRELARQHEAAADSLVAFEGVECHGVEAEHRGSCPLLGSVRRVSPIEAGVELELGDGVDPEVVLEQTRCHIAFGRRAGREGMDACPLYVDGVRVSLDGHRLTLTTEVGRSVEDLRARARAHVIAGH